MSENKNNQKVLVIGLGYIGLPTAALIASKGIKVIGVDVKKEIVETINRGSIHIKEPDLGGLVKNIVERGFLVAKTKPEKADVFIISVPTPFKNGYEPDLSYVESAVDSIIPYLEKKNIVVLESTSPIGTTEKIAKRIYEKRKDLKDNLYLAYCPERVLPGKIIYELEHNDRVIGGINSESSIKVKNFYSNFVKGEIYITDSKTAEMVKLVENAYRDINIAFANEISLIADKAKINVKDVINLANKHPRVNILNPGIGVGGHCIPVDPWFLIKMFPDESKLMKTAREVNLYKTEWVIEKIKKTALEFEEKYGRKPMIAALGLTYKPDVDDLRESPALYIVKKLIVKKFNILPVEPNIEKIKDLELYPLDKAINESDIIVFLVGHKVFKDLNISSEKIILNFCGL